MRRRMTTFAVLSMAAIWLAALPTPAVAQEVEPPVSDSPALSADGRWLAFISTSDDLIEPGGSGADDLLEDAFLVDLQTGNVRLISRSQLGDPANGPTTDVDVSADGRYVAFVSEATNLLTTDANGPDSDVFVLDTQTGALILASRRGAAGVQGNGASRDVSMSDDGTRIAFISYSSNLVANDTNGQPDAFVRDLVTGTTTRVSTNSNGRESATSTLETAISGNGAVVAFQNTAKLVREDTNGRRDVYVKLLASGKTQLVSVTNREQPANSDSTLADLSRNGRFVAFTSIASNLVGSDTNRVADAFVRDRTGGTTIRVSRNGITEANGATYEAALSPDAAYVAFTTEATNLGGEVTDGNGPELDVFEYDMATGGSRRIGQDLTGGWPDGPSFEPTYGTPSVVALTSWATDLASSDADPEADVYTVDLDPTRATTGTIIHRSISAVP